MKSKLVYWLTYAGMWLLALLPFRALYILSDGVCFLMRHVVHYRRKVVRKNLKNSFPEKSEAELREIEREFYRYICDYMLEEIKMMRMSFEDLSRRVHGIGAGAFVAEIQQTSDITYRIFDYNRKDKEGKSRELHTSQATEAINFADVQDDFRTEYDHLKNEPVELVASPYFTTSLYDMTEEITCDYSELDSFVIFICVEGACRITDDSQNEIAVRAGETILLPAITREVTIVPEDGGVKLLETYL